MKVIALLVATLASASFANEKTIQILTPSKAGEATTIVPVVYSVQHPLLTGGMFRAIPFPGLRQLIVSRKVSKLLYTSNAGELFEALELPLSKTEKRRVLQKIMYGGLEGVSGESLPLAEDSRTELAAYFASKYEEEKSLEGFSKVVFLLQQKKDFNFNREKACAFLKANQQAVLDAGVLTKSALAVLFKSSCSSGSG